MKQQVLFLGDLDRSLPEFVAFAEKYECIFYTLPSLEETLHDFRTKFANVLAIYGAWLGFIPLGGYRGALVDAAPALLKIISICSVGHEKYDGAAMAAKNIILTNVPSDGAAELVADLVLWNALASFRHFKAFSVNFTEQHNSTVKVRGLLDLGEYNLQQGRCVLKERGGFSFGEVLGDRLLVNPRGHNVVIVGFGNIGRIIGLRLHSVGMQVHYVKRLPLSAAEEQALGYPATYHATLADTTGFADLVVVACPATPETEHLVDAALIERMAKPFRIINIGRGQIIDEAALVHGLELGKVLFAGLDVFEKEPQVDVRLFGRHDVILTPHIGASTHENFNHTAVQALANIDLVLSGGAPRSRVN